MVQVTELYIPPLHTQSLFWLAHWSCWASSMKKGFFDIQSSFVQQYVAQPIETTSPHHGFSGCSFGCLQNVIWSWLITHNLIWRYCLCAWFCEQNKTELCSGEVWEKVKGLHSGIHLVWDPELVLLNITSPRVQGLPLLLFIQPVFHDVHRGDKVLGRQ